jgi:hypothetical protein
LLEKWLGMWFPLEVLSSMAKKGRSGFKNILMRFIQIVLISSVLCSCNGDLGPGALGGWNIIVFKTSEKNLKFAIDSLFKTKPKYKHINKWKYEAEYWVKDHSYLKTVIFYFEGAPEEMYYVNIRGIGHW